jgi:tol-pal system protein YbgF
MYIFEDAAPRVSISHPFPAEQVMKRKAQGALLLIFGLGGCAAPSQEMEQRLEQWQSEQRQEVEALKRAVEASYDRERAMADRLRQAEEANAQLRQEMHALRDQSTTLRARLDSMQTTAPPAVQPRTGRTQEADALRTYQRGLENYRNRRYETALGQFGEILSTAPYSEWADNAQYWKGECYYGLGKYSQALAEFTKVFAYRKTEKADDAQLKIGRCYLALGERDRALQAFQKLLDEYPQSEYVEAARKEMKHLGGP